MDIGKTIKKTINKKKISWIPRKVGKLASQNIGGGILSPDPREVSGPPAVFNRVPCLDPYPSSRAPLPGPAGPLKGPLNNTMANRKEHLKQNSFFFRRKDDSVSHNLFPV